MKPIKYMRHAKNRMRRHKIAGTEVESAIEKPHFLEPSLEGRLNAWVKHLISICGLHIKKKAIYMVMTAVKKKKG